LFHGVGKIIIGRIRRTIVLSLYIVGETGGINQQDYYQARITGEVIKIKSILLRGEDTLESPTLTNSISRLNKNQIRHPERARLEL
jgi:hypothetical protein